MYNIEELTEYLKIGSFWEEKRSGLDMKDLNLLFICQCNAVRSRTAEMLWDSPNRNVMSAGIDENARVRITPEMISDSDVIFVMEEYQEEYLRKNFASQIGSREAESN